MELVQALEKVSNYISIQPSQDDVLGFVGDNEETQLWFYSTRTSVALCEEIQSFHKSHLILIKLVHVCKLKHCLGLIVIRN